MSQNIARKKKTLPKSIRPEEFIELIKHTKKNDRQARIAFLLAYGAGLRLSEVTHLEKLDVSDRIYIRFKEGWNPKYNKERVVPLPKGWKSWMLEELPIKKSGRSLERNFKRACRLARLPDYYTFHSLRHGFATRLSENGVPITHVQNLLGHSDLSTTSIYTKARQDDALKSYEELF